MTALASSPSTRPHWGKALSVAVVGHAVALAAVLLLVRQAAEREPDPVMIVELPGLPPPPAAAQPQPQAEPVETPDVPQPVVTPQPTPPIDAPKIAVPVPKEALVVPPRPVQAAAAPPQPAATSAPPVTTPQPAAATSLYGDDPKAKKAEADYFAILAAYLQRRKDYPAEAKRARQQGVVTVRFTVDRRGNVSAEGIKRSSGSDILDSATLALLRRISPMPPMPASVKRDSVTIALPIEYSLSTK